MLADFPKFQAILRDFLEKSAGILIGEPARIVRKSTLDRLERLAYRETLREAATKSNHDFIEQEIQKNQLTQADLKRLARKQTPIEQWPDVEDGLVSPTLFDAADVNRGELTLID